jgi:hypothetical protein
MISYARSSGDTWTANIALAINPTGQTALIKLSSEI